MAKKKTVTAFVEESLGDFLKEKGLELYNCEFVKEGKDRFLRVYIDKMNPEEYISIEECQLVSGYLDEKLEEDDFIEGNYFLEVSSPGMDRELLRQEHFDRYEGHIVDLKLYRGIDGKKIYRGELLGRKDGQIIIKEENGEEKRFSIEDVAKTNLAVIF